MTGPRDRRQGGQRIRQRHDLSSVSHPGLNATAEASGDGFKIFSSMSAVGARASSSMAGSAGHRCRQGNDPRRRCGVGRASLCPRPRRGRSYGISRLLEILENEISICIALLGVTSFAALDKSYLCPARLVVTPHVHGAFPISTCRERLTNRRVGAPA